MAATVEVLDPDVVIALDPTALGVASGWCDGRRSTTVVELTQDMTYDVELVSWRIGVAQGRLRARIGRGVGAGALADLVNRLCSGPQPLPPTRSPSVSRVDLDLRHRRASVPPSRSKARRAPSTTSIVVISPPTEPTTHMEALATELALTNKVHRLPPDTAEAALVESAALVLISSKVAADQADDIIGRRGATRRPTLIDVEPADAFDLAALAAGEALVRPDLTVAARASVVVVPSRTIGAALRTPTLSPHVVPYLAGRPDMLTLTGAAEDRTPPEHPVIGWRIGGWVRRLLQWRLPSPMPCSSWSPRGCVWRWRLVPKTTGHPPRPSGAGHPPRRADAVGAGGVDDPDLDAATRVGRSLG